MKRRRLNSAIIGGLLVFVMAATAFVGPGIRHSHKAGKHAHSHAWSQTVAGTNDAAEPHTHSHTGRHSHGSHFHSHEHPHVKSGDLSDDEDIDDVHSHVHFSLLGFEFTWPDSLSDDDTHASGATASNGAPRSARSAEATVIITGPFTVMQLVQVLLLPAAPLPERAVLPEPDRNGQHVAVWILQSGRLRDAPELPPPNSA